MLQTSNKTTATLTLDTLLTEETLRLSVTLQISLKVTYHTGLAVLFFTLVLFLPFDAVLMYSFTYGSGVSTEK